VRKLAHQVPTAGSATHQVPRDLSGPGLEPQRRTPGSEVDPSEPWGTAKLRRHRTPLGELLPAAPQALGTKLLRGHLCLNQRMETQGVAVLSLTACAALPLTLAQPTCQNFPCPGDTNSLISRLTKSRQRSSQTLWV
jgi:hypothetical protein